MATPLPNTVKHLRSLLRIAARNNDAAKWQTYYFLLLVELGA